MNGCSLSTVTNSSFYLNKYYFLILNIFIIVLGVNLELVKISKENKKSDDKRSELQRNDSYCTVVTPFLFRPVLSGFFGEPY